MTNTERTIEFSKVIEAMMVPIWARAVESERPDALVLDPKAVYMMQVLNPDVRKLQSSQVTQLGCVARCAILDEEASAFLESHPGAIVINFGAGLDTRSYRLSHLSFKAWYDVDLPNVMRVRKELISSLDERICSIEASALEVPSWIHKIRRSGEPCLLIAEGLLMYCEKSVVEKWLKDVANAFPGSHCLFEMTSPFMLKHQSRDSRIMSGDKLLWALENNKEFEEIDSRYHFLKDCNLCDKAKSRWGVFGLLARLPFLSQHFNQKIAVLSIG